MGDLEIWKKYGFLVLAAFLGGSGGVILGSPDRFTGEDGKRLLGKIELVSENDDRLEKKIEAIDVKVDALMMSVGRLPPRELEREVDRNALKIIELQKHLEQQKR